VGPFGLIFDLTDEMVRTLKLWLILMASGFVFGWLVGNIFAIIELGPGGEVIGTACGLTALLCGCQSPGSGNSSLPVTPIASRSWEYSEFGVCHDDPSGISMIDSDRGADAWVSNAGHDEWQYAAPVARGLSNGADVALALSGCCTGTDADILMPADAGGWSVDAGMFHEPFPGDDFGSGCSMDCSSGGFSSGLSDDW